MNSHIYRQYDNRWRWLPYPSGGYYLNGSGCGCVAVTHCIIEMDKYKNWTPAKVQPYMRQFAIRGNGTKWAGIQKSLEHYGLKNVANVPTMAKLWKILEKGNYVGVLLFGNTKGPDGTVWTTGGHYIAFTGYRVKNGQHQLYLKDSGGRKHDGWYSYEKSMRGDVRQVWVGQVPTTAKATTTITTTTKVAAAATTTATSGKLTVDGVGGAGTVKALQKYLKVTQDGKITGQNKSLNKYYPSLTAVSYGSGGCATVKALQKWVGATADGVWGQDTSKKLQKKLGVTADGIFGTGSMKALQKFLNSQTEEKKEETKTTTTTPAKTETKVETKTEATPAAPVQPTTTTEQTKEPKAYSGTMPTLALKKTTAQVIADALTWMKWIASDNSFHYGYTNAKKTINAHHNGCYFCGTNTTSGGRSKKGIVDYKKTYCCNPFAGAGWAHGGGDATALALCQKGSSWDYHKKRGYDSSKLFKKLGHPVKSKLQPGDVLCRNTHVAVYAGDGKIVEAGAGDDNVRNSAKWNNSIRVCTLTDANYKKFPRVYRYTGKVNVASRDICHGEVSYRVKYLQQYLNWYFDKQVCTTEGIFGEETLKYVKAFQTARKIKVDGVVGKNTLAEMAKVKK